jgi:hypothetical protein
MLGRTKLLGLGLELELELDGLRNGVCVNAQERITRFGTDAVSVDDSAGPISHKAQRLLLVKQAEEDNVSKSLDGP